MLVFSGPGKARPTKLATHKQPLTWDEVNRAAVVGITRATESRKLGIQDRSRFKDKEKAVVIDINGAAAELAVAKFLGIEWSGSVNTFRTGGDAGQFQVRNKHPRYGTIQLCVALRDPNAIYVLTSGVIDFTNNELPIFTLHGWMHSRDVLRLGVKNEWGQYVVFPNQLRPMDELPISY